MSRPINAVTHQEYQGSNVAVLLSSGRKIDGGKAPRWCTFLQAKSKGWSIKKGVHGTKIEYWSELSPKTEENSSDSNEKPRKKLVRRVYVVFHASQIEGIEDFSPITSRQ